MTRYIVYATLMEKIATMHVEAETRNDALAAFYQEFKDRVGPAWNLDVWEVEGNPLHEKHWKGHGYTGYHGGYYYF
jgi:hypothetical protein